MENTYLTIVLAPLIGAIIVGLAILTLMYRNRGSIDVDVTNSLKG